MVDVLYYFFRDKTILEFLFLFYIGGGFAIGYCNYVFHLMYGEYKKYSKKQLALLILPFPHGFILGCIVHLFIYLKNKTFNSLSLFWKKIGKKEI